jgi:hypothetical protein
MTAPSCVSQSGLAVPLYGVFKLRAGSAREALLGASTPFPRGSPSSPGSCRARWSRTARARGRSTRSLAEAHAAAVAAMSSESCAPMFALIDMESTLMLHGEGVHVA